MLDISEEGVITDILFRGSSLELVLDVGGIRLTTHRSLERRPVEVGEHMRVIVYRLFACDDNEAKLLENGELVRRGLMDSYLDARLYGGDRYFVG